LTSPSQLSFDFPAAFEADKLEADVLEADMDVAVEIETKPVTEFLPVVDFLTESPVPNEPKSISGYETVVGNPRGFSMLPEVGKDGRPAPIPYQLKVSSKARQVYLRVEPGRGLQVTIPKRYAKRSIPALVESQRKWVTDALIDLDEKILPMYRHWPPNQLYLHACDTTVQILYRKNVDPTGATFEWRNSDQLLIDVDCDNKPLLATCIAGALKPKARSLLGPWLKSCSEQTGLTYKRMAVRGQKTVWGSCSTSGTLSLNYKLLFLRPDLVDYVLLHELAHTRHMDHSAAFWRFLDEIKPNAREFDRELTEAGALVPPWLELAGTG